jgi:acyl carrier protein
MDTLEETILSLIREALIYAAPEKKEHFDKLDWNSSLSSIGLDSIGLLDASAYLEEKTGAHFPDDKLAVVEKVGDFGALLRQHFEAKAQQGRPQP